MHSLNPIFQITNNYQIKPEEMISSWHKGESFETVPNGWYFWCEIWTDFFGPFNTKEETEKVLNNYIQTI